MYLEIRYFYFIWKSDKTVCSRRGQFPLRGKGKGPLAQRSLPLRPPPETWGTPPVPHAPSWHKGAGLRSLPFGNPSQGDGGRGTRARPLPFGNPSRSWTGERQRKEKQRVSYLHPVVLHARRCGGALIEIQVERSRQVGSGFCRQCVPAAPSYG